MKAVTILFRKKRMISRLNILLYIYILIFHFPQLSFSQSNWFWQQPLPTGNEMKGIYFPTPEVGFTVGTLGTIEKTTDGGASWVKLVSGVSVNLGAVFFMNANTGIVTGDSGTILRTSNGGSSWNSISSPAQYFLYDVMFPTDLVGYIIGIVNIYKTTNGGFNWIQLTNFGGFTIDFYNESFGAMGGTQRLDYTTNGGVNWISSGLSFGFLDQVIGISQTEINTIIGLTNSSDRVLKTTNSGNNWIEYYFGPTLDDIPRSSTFINSYTGYLVTEDRKSVV